MNRIAIFVILILIGLSSFAQKKNELENLDVALIAQVNQGSSLCYFSNGYRDY